MTTKPFTPKKRMWTPPAKSDPRKKQTPPTAMGCLAGLKKYVGTDYKPKPSKAPKVDMYAHYAQGKDQNPEFVWTAKNGSFPVGTLTTQHLVGIIGYLYWVNAKHLWLVNSDLSKIYQQHDMTFEGSYIRKAFDTILVEIATNRKADLTPAYSTSLNKIVKHIVVLRSRAKKKAPKREKMTA